LYWDNVGAELLDASLLNIKKYGLVIACGSISQYNVKSSEAYGIRNAFLFVTKSLALRGFLLHDFATRYPEGIAKLATWLEEGKIQDAQTEVQGFDQIVPAFVSLFKSANTGKLVVKV